MSVSLSFRYRVELLPEDGLPSTVTVEPRSLREKPKTFRCTTLMFDRVRSSSPWTATISGPILTKDGSDHAGGHRQGVRWEGAVPPRIAELVDSLIEADREQLLNAMLEVATGWEQTKRQGVGRP